MPSDAPNAPVLRRDESTPEGRDYWRYIDRAAAQVETWPAWMKGKVRNEMPNEQRNGARLPLDRPACGDGDTEMKYHDHSASAVTAAEYLRKYERTPYPDANHEGRDDCARMERFAAHVTAALRAELAAAQGERDAIFSDYQDLGKQMAKDAERVVALEQALEEIAEETKRKQLPITADIHEIAERVLRPTPKEGQ